MTPLRYTTPGARLGPGLFLLSSLLSTPLQADRLQIDVIYTGSQKVLGVPPGTAPISFSPRAVESFKARTRPPCSFYLGERLIMSHYCPHFMFVFRSVLAG